MIDHIVSLYEYGEWATHRLLERVELLDPAQFKINLLPGFGSVHATLVHLLGAEVVWCARWQGESPRQLLSAEDLPTLQVIRARWAQLEQERRASLAALDEAALEEIIPYTNTRGSSFTLARWQMLLHCANHSTHHRSELAAMLSEIGHEPDSLELLEFFLQRTGQSWKPSKV